MPVPPHLVPELVVGLQYGLVVAPEQKRPLLRWILVIRNPLHLVAGLRVVDSVAVWPHFSVLTVTGSVISARLRRRRGRVPCSRKKSRFSSSISGIRSGSKRVISTPAARSRSSPR